MVSTNIYIYTYFLIFKKMQNLKMNVPNFYCSMSFSILFIMQELGAREMWRAREKISHPQLLEKN